ncbi:MAG: hypothetical protein ACOYM1_06330, partial [Methylovulum sp.]
MLKSLFKTTPTWYGLAAAMCLLSILGALVISTFLFQEVRAITSLISLSHQQQMLTERMALLAHKRSIAYQLAKDPRAIEDELRQAIASYQALLTAATDYQHRTTWFDKGQPFNETQRDLMVKQRAVWIDYQFKLRHFINDERLFIQQLQAIEESEQQQYELASRFILSIEAHSDTRLTNFKLLRLLIILTVLLSLSCLFLINITQVRVLRKKNQQQNARLHLLDACLQRANDVIIICEAGSIDEPEGPCIVYVNETFVRVTGYSVEEVL